MEGNTGHIYRNAYNTYFDHIDKYFAPFIVADQKEGFATRDLNNILPEHNTGLVLIPQLLSNNAKDFIFTSKKISAFGYDEINLNLGCPSGTVVSKNRGSGFLAMKEELNAFLEEIFEAQVTKISVKTRLGKERPDEFYELMEIFNKFPMEELIIHPRVQTDMYRNKPNMKVFKETLAVSKNPVCYNGDIFTVQDYMAFTSAFPDVDRMMLGRGLLTNPGLIEHIQKGTKLDKAQLRRLHDKVYEDYKALLFGDRNVLCKMKELWFYMIQAFTDNAKYAKKIKKAEKCRDYDKIIDSLFAEQDILDEFRYVF